MVINEIVSDGPLTGDICQLELGNIMIEASIVAENSSITLLLDDYAIKLLNQHLIESIDVDPRIKSKILRTIAQLNLDEMPYKRALETLSLHVFGRENYRNSENLNTLKKFYPDPNNRTVFEAEYHGRKVSLGKPFLTPDGPKKRSVYVKNAKGNVVKVNFGDKKMRIKKSNPARRKSFRARHNCSNPGPRWKAKYWSCKAW